MSIAVAFAADKTPFKAAPAASYAHHQVNDKVTIGVEAFSTPDQMKAGFGKVNPYERGVLPVLLVIQNDGDKAIRLDQLKAEYVGPGGNRVEATPAKDVRYLNGAKKPTVIPGPTGPVPVRLKKNPLDAWEIEGRAFAAQMLPAGNTASGFVYFQTGLHSTATIYVSGLVEAGTGKEIIYFEIPLR